MFADIMKKPDIIDININDLSSLITFVRRIKTECSTFELPLALIRGYIEKKRFKNHLNFALGNISFFSFNACIVRYAQLRKNGK